jgi:hypothetical protein
MVSFSLQEPKQMRRQSFEARNLRGLEQKQTFICFFRNPLKKYRVSLTSLPRSVCVHHRHTQCMDYLCFAVQGIRPPTK